MPKLIINIRETILEKGKEMLLNGSYRDFNIRNLARNCNLGLGTLYNYFSNKNELAYYIFKYDWDQTLALVEALKSSDIPFKDKLRQIYTSLETFVGQYMEIFHEIAGSTARECPYDNYREIYVKMKELLEAECKDGRIHTEIGSERLSYFLISNLLYIAKNKTLTFDELYSCFSL